LDRGVVSEHALGVARQLGELASGYLPAARPYPLDQHQQREQLRGVRLGRRHRALASGGHVHVQLGGSGQR
jgi:hypothetical protein